MLKAQNLTKKFKKKLAVDNVSFEVQTGKVTGFLGPNGAGKSTTMRLILGLDKGGGKATFDNKYLYNYKQPSKVVGILLEAKAFHPTRSARNHLRILAAAGNISDKRVDEVLDIVGLKDVAKKKPGKFSLGMSQRLGIAAAILGQPKYLILDEPANGLDPEGIVWLRKFLETYADKGNGVFVSSHLLSEMAQMADNVVVIGKGKLIADTSIKELISGSARSGIIVRSDKPAQLEKLAQKQGWNYVKTSNSIQISGITTDEAGKQAFQNGIALFELASHNASLEDIFLELTEGEEEYSARIDRSQK